MFNTFITYLQIFGIGFSFGLAGPCLLTCTPVLITYIAGSKREPPGAFKDIFTFLSGRLLAYLLLGALAGLSGAALKKFTDSSLASYLHPLAGAVTILFAVILLTSSGNVSCACPTTRGKTLNYGGIFAFGFLIGLSPCAPLLALLFDITLMSRSMLDGIFYAFFFGLGTLTSGIITIGVIAGLLTRIPPALIKSKTANMIFKAACAILLMILGLALMFGMK
jgi:hypothetical protein